MLGTMYRTIVTNQCLQGLTVDTVDIIYSGLRYHCKISRLKVIPTLQLWSLKQKNSIDRLRYLDQVLFNSKA